MTKIKSTPLAVAKEKADAKRERRLPDGLPTTNYGAELSAESSRRTALAFLLADVMYTLLYDVSVEMNSVGREIKHDSKRRFNDLFAAIEKAKTSALRSSKDLMGFSSEIQNSYVTDAEWLREVVELLYDRSQATDDAHDRIRAIIFNLPKYKD